MNTILVDVEEKYKDREWYDFLERLREEGVRVLTEMVNFEHSGQTACALEWTVQEDGPFPPCVPQEILILTDRQELAEWARKEGIACVGYEPLGTDNRISGVDMVIQGVDELDAEFFRLIYLRYHGLPWVLVQTKRLTIRESVPEDFEELYDIYQQPGMTEFTPGMTLEKEEERYQFEQYVKHMYSFYNYGLWTVVEKESGNIVGRVGLENGQYRKQPVIELGYLIGKEWQGKGYGLEAVYAVLTYGFEVLGISELYAFIDSRNQRSLSLIGQTGFQEVEEEKGIKIFCVKYPV